MSGRFRFLLFHPVETERKKLICLTPIRNEAWVLDKFLSCASLWADHIILADDHSEDESRAIARRFPKVHLIENPVAEFDEAQRQRLLLDEARKIPGPKILFALDADEFLSANYTTSPEWQRILSAAPGSLFALRCVNVLPNFKRAWIAHRLPVIFVDDGTPHTGRRIHSRRLPTPSIDDTVELSEMKVLHLQYTDWARMRSKHAWYQCFEHLSLDLRGVALYRKYHHMDRFARRESLTVPVEARWTAEYEAQGIRMSEVLQTPYWWDGAVVKMLAEHGPAFFADVAIWDRDWNAIARRVVPVSSADLSDPRRAMQKWMHRYLRASQPYSTAWPIRMLDAALMRLGF